MTDVSAGYALLVDAVGAVELDRDVVRISGPDAIGYLQGQLSQEIEALEPGHSAWSLLLQPQGKVDAWLRVTRTAADSVLLDVDGGWGEAVVARLNRFKLRTKADIEVLDWKCLALRGPFAPATLATEATTATAVWPLIGGLDLLGPDPTADVPLVHPEAYEIRRIEAGMPRMGAEITDRTIPAEVGVVSASVSFSKGCYTGQELVARIDSRGGHVPRLLRAVHIPEGPLPPVGAPLTLDGREVGALTSVAAHPSGRGVALAIVRRDVEPPAAAACDGIPVTITSTP